MAISEHIAIKTTKEDCEVLVNNGVISHLFADLVHASKGYNFKIPKSEFDVFAEAGHIAPEFQQSFEELRKKLTEEMAAKEQSKSKLGRLIDRFVYEFNDSENNNTLPVRSQLASIRELSNTTVGFHITGSEPN